MKDKKIIIGCIAFAILIAGLAWWNTPRRKTVNEGGNSPTTATETAKKESNAANQSPVKNVAAENKGGSEAVSIAKDEAPPKETVLNSSMTPADVNRLPTEKRKLTTCIEITGKGAKADNGYQVEGDFYYVTTAICDSQIKEQMVTPLGEIKVVEHRRYEMCGDRITFGDFDMKLALDTIPLRQATPYVAAIAGAVHAFVTEGTDPEGSVKMANSIKKSVDFLYKFDGTSVKKTLRMITGFFGDEAGKTLEDWENMAKNALENRVQDSVKSTVQDVAGREYVVTYYQSKSGAKMRMRFAHADGSELTMKEHRILREINVFMSCQVFPTRRPEVGETWNIEVGEMPGLFDPFSAGSNLRGTLNAKRLADESNGDLKVDIGGGRIAVLDDDNGMEKGSFQIKEGAALITPDDRHQVRAFEMLGIGKLRLEEVKRRFIAFDFITQITGDCNMRVLTTSEKAE